MKRLLFLFALFCFLPSCSSEERANILRLMIWGDAPEVELVRSIVEKFERAHSNIRVKIISVNSTDYNHHFQTLFLNREAPDVVYVSREWLRFYASKGMIKNLKPFLDADREFDFNDFYPEVRTSFFYQEHPYAIAKDFTPFVLYYNEELFKKAGLTLPNQNWTWENLLSAAKQLTKMSSGSDGKNSYEQYGFVVDPWFGWILPWIWQAGGDILDEHESKSLMNEPPVMDGNVRALQFLYDLIYVHKVAPDPKTIDLLGSSSLFLSGRAAMCVYGRWMCLNFKEIKNFKWNVAPLPKDKKRINALLTVGYGISSQSRQTDSAWLLIKYLTAIEAQIQVAEYGLAVPARKSVALSHHFLQAKSLPQTLNNKIFLESLQYVRFPPAPVHWNQLEDESKNLLNLIFRQKNPVRDTLSNSHEKIKTILSTNY